MTTIVGKHEQKRQMLPPWGSMVGDTGPRDSPLPLRSSIEAFNSGGVSSGSQQKKKGWVGVILPMLISRLSINSIPLYKADLQRKGKV